MNRALLLVFSTTIWAQTPIGIFTGSRDVGAILHAGSAAFDTQTRAYTITGSGENMWATADAFHFAYRSISGDFTLSADIAFPTTGGNAHRKAVLMVRQSLDADSAYADAALHGDGLTSLQARDQKGAATHEVQSNVSAPKRLRIEKRGAFITMWVAASGEALHLSGGSVKIEFQEPFYIGLGVCAHDKGAIEKAVFSNVELTTPTVYSTLETINVASTDRRVVQVTQGVIEAPNWTPDGQSLVYNGGGLLWRIPVAGGKPVQIDTGIATRLNNDHGISPDGKYFAISDSSQEPRRSKVYVVPFAGGTARLLTEKSPSYWHGWSPDGKTLAYCADREGNFDIYVIPFEGGEEKRLTTAPGLDDGPEYSPDGRYIYFNSVRTGLMQIWRMRPDGSQQEQVTFDEANNWFPHLSPDGKRMVFISFEKDVVGHPPNKNVQLRLMNMADGKVTVLAKLFGGQGTINVPSWSPDSKRLAFVSYQLIP